MPIYLKLIPSKTKTKKYTAIFSKDIDGKRRVIKMTSFGQKGADDYTITKDKAQRKRYIDRHRKNENWSDYMSAGSLSRYLLWGTYTDIDKNITAFKRRFNLK